jgi:beta-glucanase (GH16 family)
MVFDDEFNGNALNTNVWNDDDGWTNQNNVTDSASNITESGGYLALNLASQTSGAQIASSSFGLTVGEFAEARIDFAGSGTSIDNWPAWWLSGPNWPAAGENDIAEGLGTLTVNYHSPSGTHNQGTVPGDWAGGFHTYGIYRGPNYCDVYWDGNLVKSYSTDDNGQPQTLIFTMGAANTLAYGASGQMLIDYVRVWAPAS